MNKTLISSEEEYIRFLVNQDSISDDYIESLVGIEFAFEDGTFRDDWVKGVEINEEQDINHNVYRKHEGCLFPEHYPCVMVHRIEDDYDCFGKVKFVMFYFVYPSDFDLPSSTQPTNEGVT